MSRIALRLFVAFVLTTATVLAAPTITVMSFNVESGGADPQALGTSLEDLGPADLWGFSEVLDETWALAFEEALADATRANYDTILDSTGRDDRLLIVYNADRLEPVRHFELHDINIRGRVRAPLVGQFRLKENGQELLFMVNHLYRGDNAGRHEQARLLNEWGRSQSLPVIAVGDYNFDWNLPDGDTNHDRGFDLMTANNVFKWTRPATLLKTQCSDFNSVLDFVFVSGAAQQWSGTSDILFPQANYCPDDDKRSDHRPVRARFELTGGAQGALTSRAQLLQRIEAIERELAALRALINANQ